eukprot:CAMPEP_0197260134 /NCGR_PEP_ID=MMETSP1429-20130617/83877_1 /TAXON_ID=49237 /ORGANISM="Chaetoceros  sp., Strain UNC1202" /LENGTH=250 /DNA_ID=CAMNT_0042724365 /DNA_START=107 /DNA_END=859 /DNA_ORIENTATION=-
MKQVMAYTVSFFIVYSFVLMRNFSWGNNLTDNKTFEIAHLIFRPLQGFFNLIIFLYHKVHNLQKSHRDTPTVREALAKIFKGESDESEYVISKLSLVQHHDMISRIRFAFDQHHEDSEDDEEENSNRGASDDENGVKNSQGKGRKITWKDADVVDSKSFASDDPSRARTHNQDLSGFNSVGSYISSQNSKSTRENGSEKLSLFIQDDEITGQKDKHVSFPLSDGSLGNNSKLFSDAASSVQSHDSRSQAL